MTFISQPINGQKTAEDVVMLLARNDIYVKHIPQNDSYTLTHTKTKEEFHQLIVDICDFLGLKAQNESWFPGSPSKEYENDDSDISDYGYYVCPIEFIEDDYEDLTRFDYDFDMMISNYEVTWC